MTLKGNEMGETLSRFSGDLKMPQHGSVHKELVIYADLMLWLKSADPDVFHGLSTVCIHPLGMNGILSFGDIYMLLVFML